MRVSIGRSEIRGRVQAPSSKSYTIRSLMCAGLSAGDSELVYPLMSDDTSAACDVLQKVGVKIVKGDGCWVVTGGSLQPSCSDLYCAESAATLRFMTAIAASLHGSSYLTSAPSLARRPMGVLIDALRQLGVNCRADSAGTVIVNGTGLEGGVVNLPGNVSSQFVTALLLVAPLARQGMTIRLTTPLESKPYVDMTLECLKQFDITVDSTPDYREFVVIPQTYRPTRYTVEGDWSSASYLIAAGVAAGAVTVDNLNTSSLQGDRVVVDFLRQMGASVATEGNSLSATRSILKGIRIDLTDSIDLLPTMAVVASLAEGQTELWGIARARLKESDRVAAVTQELRKAGVTVLEGQDCLKVTGTRPRGAVFQSHGDHRIAMAFGLLGLVTGNVIIEGAECVSKTYPSFWQVLSSLGAEVGIDG